MRGRGVGTGSDMDRGRLGDFRVNGAECRKLSRILVQIFLRLTHIERDLPLASLRFEKRNVSINPWKLSKFLKFFRTEVKP